MNRARLASYARKYFRYTGATDLRHVTRSARLYNFASTSVEMLQVISIIFHLYVARNYSTEIIQ